MGKEEFNFSFPISGRRSTSESLPMNIGLLRVKITKVCRGCPESNLQWQAEFQVDPSQCVKSFAVRKMLQAVVHLSFAPFICQEMDTGILKRVLFLFRQPLSLSRRSPDRVWRGSGAQDLPSLQNAPLSFCGRPFCV